MINSGTPACVPVKSFLLQNVRADLISLSAKDTQPSQTCSEGYTFSATALYWGASLFLGSNN